jgi:ABC-2 type transport system ATP-binding protein
VGHIISDSTLPELLERTGAPDAEQAFLALVDAENAKSARSAGRPGGEAA